MATRYVFSGSMSDTARVFPATYPGWRLSANSDQAAGSGPLAEQVFTGHLAHADLLRTGVLGGEGLQGDRPGGHAVLPAVPAWSMLPR